jgi:uncharacterized protein
MFGLRSGPPCSIMPPMPQLEKALDGAEARSSGTARPFRVLSLDGGGAKGVYTLGVLKEVEAAAHGVPLYQVFDLIFGTSTGSIIAALLALGYSVTEIEGLYFKLIPAIMKKWRAKNRTMALQGEATTLFGDRDFTAFKVAVGIVCANYEFERPMVFKNKREQAHGRVETTLSGHENIPLRGSVLLSAWIGAG